MLELRLGKEKVSLLERCPHLGVLKEGFHCRTKWLNCVKPTLDKSTKYYESPPCYGSHSNLPRQVSSFWPPLPLSRTWPSSSSSSSPALQRIFQNRAELRLLSSPEAGGCSEAHPQHWNTGPGEHVIQRLDHFTMYSET